MTHQIHVSSLSARVKRPYPPGYGFPAPFGRRHSLLGSSCPRCGIGPSFRRSSGLPDARLDRNGIAAFRTSEKRSGWVLPLLRGRGVPARNTVRIRVMQGASPCFVAHHRLANHLVGDFPSRSLVGSSLAFTRPIFPSPGSPGWFGSALGFTPLLSHASLPGACMGWGLVWTLAMT